MSDGKREHPWREWDGRKTDRDRYKGPKRPPYPPGTMVYVQLRCWTREEAEKRPPRPVEFWTHWDVRNDAGDIIAVKRA